MFWEQWSNNGNTTKRVKIFPVDEKYNKGF